MDAVENACVALWSQVEIEIEYVDETDRLRLLIVPDEQADFARGFLGVGTPLARAILGEKAGAQVPYYLGDARSVRVLALEATEPQKDRGTALRRQQVLRQAVEQAERTSAMIFASSFSGKWGDYDPQGIEAWQPAEDRQDRGQDLK